jgi:nucleolar protein 6
MVKNRFIAFIGNLPFDTTKEDIQTFFKCLGDIQIRMRSDENGKFKGFCFIECSDNDQFQKILKMHHLKFGGRKINVELSAGGGGNSQARKKKIMQKNEKIKKYRISLNKSVKKK